MDRMQRDAVLLELIEALRNGGSWCGETHVQKSVFFLQNLLNVPLGFDYILYKHGPFSFDLSDTLAQMQADSFLKYMAKPPYGPSLVPGENSQLLQRLYSRTRENYRPRIAVLANRLAAKNVAQLEQISTAMYVTLNSPTASSTLERAQKLNVLKPHIPIELAQKAIAEFDEIKKDTADIAA